MPGEGKLSKGLRHGFARCLQEQDAAPDGRAGRTKAPGKTGVGGKGLNHHTVPRDTEPPEVSSQGTPPAATAPEDNCWASGGGAGEETLEEGKCSKNHLQNQVRVDQELTQGRGRERRVSRRTHRAGD